ncbi:MAG TPA: 30S ribosomal protein S16 [Candidatus Eisenbacteria bacterium]|jgi:small subunit ribosomal protein S16
MAVVIRLMRAGAKKRPFFRMVAADSRRQRDGRFLEILGHYNPLTQPYELVVHKDKVEAWLSKGAQPSEQAASLLRSLGIQPSAPPRPAAAPATEPSTPPARKPKPAAKAAPRRAAARKLSDRKLQKKVARRAAKAKKHAKT